MKARVEQGDIPFLDITAPDHGVQVQVRDDGKVLWVHVDGVAVLRICQIPQLEVDDPTNDFLRPR